MPSTRDLARQLGVSRRVVVDAYAQLAAEGYLNLRQGARPRVSEQRHRRRARRRGTIAPTPAPRCASTSARAVPDLSAFPRGVVAAVAARGAREHDRRRARLRRSARRRPSCARRSPTTSAACAAWSPTPSASSSPTATRRGSALVCRALAAGAPGGSASRTRATSTTSAIVTGAGLEPVPIGVDEDGLRVDELARPAPDAVIVTPAHQQPTGVVLSRERRAGPRATGCASTARSRSRTTTTPSTATTALPSARSRGSRPSASSTPARPARRSRRRSASAGSSCPPHCSSRSSRRTSCVADRGAARIEQHAFADFIARGELDRHLRRMRARYRRRRDALVRGARARSCPRRRSRASPPACTRRSSCPTATTRRRSATRPPVAGSSSTR